MFYICNISIYRVFILRCMVTGNKNQTFADPVFHANSNILRVMEKVSLFETSLTFIIQCQSSS